MHTKFYGFLVIVFLISLIGLGSWGFTESSEARYAEMGREMYLSRDFVHPTKLGIQHYHKPPITYYITTLGYELFGLNEFGARFFLSVALAIQILIIYKMAFLLFNDRKKAWFSALIYFSFPVVLISIRNLTTDAYLTTFILAALYSWLQLNLNKSVLFLYLFYIFLGIAFLTKGPVAFIPVLLFIAVWKICKKEKITLTPHHFFGIIILLLISASWFLVVLQQDPALWDYFVQEQIVKRTTDAEHFHRSAPFWYYFALAPAIGFPWLLFIGFEYFFQKSNSDSTRIYSRIMAFTFLLGIVLFSIFSGKLILYILPFYGFLALLGGNLLATTSLKHKIFYKNIFIGLLIILLGAVIFLNLSPSFDLNLIWSIILILMISACIVYLWKFSEHNKTVQLFGGSVAFSAIILLFFAAFASSNDYKINSVKELVQEAERNRGGAIEQLVIYDYLLPSAAFYTEDKILTIYNSDFNSKRDVRFQNNEKYKKHYVNVHESEDLRRLHSLMQQKKTIILARKKNQIPDSLNFILKNLPNKELVDKWVIYY